jgi:hypothetical protein
MSPFCHVFFFAQGLEAGHRRRQKSLSARLLTPAETSPIHLSGRQLQDHQPCPDALSLRYFFSGP